MRGEGVGDDRQRERSDAGVRARKGSSSKAVKVMIDRYIFASIDNFAITALTSGK